MDQNHVQLLETLRSTSSFLQALHSFALRCILLCKAEGKKSFLSHLISFDDIAQSCVCVCPRPWVVQSSASSAAETMDTKLPQMGWKWRAEGMETLRNPTGELRERSSDHYHVLKIRGKSCRAPELYKGLVKLLGHKEACVSTTTCRFGVFFRCKWAFC